LELVRKRGASQELAHTDHPWRRVRNLRVHLTRREVFGIRRRQPSLTLGDASEEPRMRQAQLLAGEGLRCEPGEPFGRDPHLLR
jgi:hypothetical protein